MRAARLVVAVLLAVPPRAWGAATTQALPAHVIPSSMQAAEPAPDGLPQVPEVVGQPVEVQPQEEETLWLRSPAFEEEFRGSYKAKDGGVSAEASEKIDHLMRSKRGGEIKSISPQLIELLASIQERFQGARIEVLCGYRTPEENRALRKRSHRVARESYHMYGMAADIRVVGVSAAKVRDFARSLQAGGVGYYPQRGFVHVDVGPVRYWGASSPSRSRSRRRPASSR